MVFGARTGILSAIAAVILSIILNQVVVTVYLRL